LAGRVCACWGGECESVCIGKAHVVLVYRVVKRVLYVCIYTHVCVLRTHTHTQTHIVSPGETCAHVNV
jgi:hypothetical protein